MRFLVRAGLAAFVALGVTWAIASLWFPLGWDQGILASIGSVIVRGGMPYRDAWDMKGPLAYYGFALAEALFGPHPWSARVLDILLLAAGCIALARIVARRSTPLTGIFAGALCLLWYESLGYRNTLQPDGWVAMAITLAVGLLLSGPAILSLRRLAVAGLVVGCCALIKPLYVVFCLVLGVWIWSRRGDVGGRSLRTAAVVALVATALPVLFAVVWFAHRGALREFIDLDLRYAMSYSAIDRSWRGTVGALAQCSWPVLVVIALPALAAGVVALRGRAGDGLGLALTTWIATAVLCVVAQRRLWCYQWLPTYPPLAALGALGLAWLAGAAGARAPPRPAWLTPPVGAGLAGVLGLIMLLTAAVGPARPAATWLQFVAGRASPAALTGQFGGARFAPRDDVAASDYIAGHTRQPDRVAVWGDNADITFLSGRANPTRFVFNMPLTNHLSDALEQQYRREYLNGLRAQPPVYFVVGQQRRGSKEQSLRDFPELAQFLCREYRFEISFGYVDLYRRTLADSNAAAFCVRR